MHPAGTRLAKTATRHTTTFWFERQQAVNELEAGETYVCTTVASNRAVDELSPLPARGVQPGASGSDLAITVEGTNRADAIPAGGPPPKGSKGKSINDKFI